MADNNRSYDSLQTAVERVWSGSETSESAVVSDGVSVGIEAEDDDAIAVNVQVEGPVDKAETVERLRDVSSYEDLADKVEENVESCFEGDRVHLTFYRQPTPFTTSVTFRGVLQPEVAIREGETAGF